MLSRSDTSSWSESRIVPTTPDAVKEPGLEDLQVAVGDRIAGCVEPLILPELVQPRRHADPASSDALSQDASSGFKVGPVESALELWPTGTGQDLRF